MAALSVSVGDTVIVTGGYRSGVWESKITKVGRLYAYIEEYGHKIGFSLKDGVENSDSAARRRIYLPEQWAENERRHALLERLREDHNLTTYRSTTLKIDNDTLEAILELLDTRKGSK